MRALYRSSEAASRLRSWCQDRLERWEVPHTTTHLPTTLGQTSLTCAGEAPDVALMLPGAGLSSAVLLGTATELVAQFRVVVADLPGQPGLSSAERLARKDQTPGYSVWVTEVLDWVHDEHPGARVLIVGHGLGAAIALTAPPDEVDALLLFAPAGLFAATRSERGRGSGGAEDMDEWRELVSRTTTGRDDGRPLPKDVFSRWSRVPVQVAVGTEDRVFPVQRMDAAARSRLGVAPTVVPGAGHLLPYEQPRLVGMLARTLMNHLPV